MSEEKRAHAIAVIERNARAQRAIVDQLLDISAVMTGKLRIRLSQVDLSAVVDLAVEGFRAAADAKRLRLSVDLERDDALLRGDSERLYQVVTSLVSNAVKFSRKDGSVVVRLRRVESDFELTVSDDGEGIEPRVVPLLFETFRQADGSYARTHGGLGIGLSITKHLVELHGGTITAKSDGPGRGATFVVRIPVTAVASNTLPPAKAAARSMGTAPVTNNVAPAAGGMRVLVVDDDDGTRELVTTIFEAAGMVVRAAGSAEEARAALDAFDADVVLSDVGMPNEDGHALIRSLRTSPIAERRSLPAVALSAFARLEDRRRALAEGFNAYLLKPVEPQELVRTVTELGSTRALRRP